MKRLFGAALAVLSLVGGARAHAAADADPFPQLVLSTPAGPVVITLSSEAAPQHVAALLAAVDGGAAASWHIDRVASGSYVQLGAAVATSIVGLANETGAGVGNVAGAVSVYDGPDAVPTLLIVLAESRHLDGTYTPVGWVEAGLDHAHELSHAEVGSGGLPAADQSVGPLRRGDADTLATLGAVDARPLPLAAVVLMLVAAAGAAAVGLALPRLDRSVAVTLLLSVALIGFFAAWTASVGRTTTRPAAAVLLFVLAIALFRAMGKFEQPRQGARRSIRQPAEPSSRP